MRTHACKLAAVVLVHASILVAAAMAFAGTAGNRDFGRLDEIVRSEIAAGRVPGAVVEVGEGGKIVYRRAFGFRELKPARVPMTPDTIFDLASLTKPVATAVAIMQIAEQGRIDLDSPVAR